MARRELDLDILFIPLFYSCLSVCVCASSAIAANAVIPLSAWPATLLSHLGMMQFPLLPYWEIKGAASSPFSL